jgi:hypothetical protein
MNKKILAILFISITIVTLAFYSYVSVYRLPTETAKESNNIVVKADSYITIKDANGKVKYYYEHPALLTNAGKESIEGILGNQFGTEPTYDYIAVGGNTSAMAVTDTTLANEFATGGLTRAQGTYASTGTGAWRLEKDFAVTGTVNNINSTGLFNASSTGSLLAEDTFANTNVINGDTLNITWTVSVS